MKNHLLLITGSILLLLVAIAFGTGELFTVLSFPFTRLGDGLRQLSLSGTVGNITAIVLYAIIALLPLTYLLRKKWGTEDLLLPLCTALLFYVLYYMINPTLRPAVLQNSVGDGILSGVIYSTLLSWAVIKLISRCDTMRSETLFHTLRLVLIACAVLLLPATAVSFDSCRAEIVTIQTANTAPNLDLTATFALVFFSFAVIALEYLLTAVLLLLAAKLVHELERDPYSPACTLTAQQTAHWARRSVRIVILTNTALQIVQLLSAKYVHHIAVNFHIPLLGIAVPFALLALSRLLCAARELKDDNNLFI